MLGKGGQTSHTPLTCIQSDHKLILSKPYTKGLGKFGFGQVTVRKVITENHLYFLSNQNVLT